MTSFLRATGWFLVAIAAAFDLFAIATALNLHAEAIEAKIFEIASANKQLFAVTVGALAFGESMPFVSVLLPFWGMLVGIGAILPKTGLDFKTIVAAAAVGAALGDWLAYSIGYYASDWARKKGLMDPEKGGWLGSFVAKVEPRLHTFLEHKILGPLVITVARFSGPFRATVPVLAGAAKMPWWLFQIANWASAFLWAFVLLWFGEAFFEAIVRFVRYLF